MAPTTTKNETILLCDDEQSVRELVRTVLTRYGYQVLEAKHGKHALELAETHSGPIHLLLSDVCMPELDGPSLAKQLRAARPDVPVIFMSAYCKELEFEQYVFVQKPFVPNTLVATIRQTLAQRGGGTPANDAGRSMELQ